MDVMVNAYKTKASRLAVQQRQIREDGWKEAVMMCGKLIIAPVARYREEGPHGIADFPCVPQLVSVV